MVIISSKGGLIIYIDLKFNYKLIKIPNQCTNWEGQFIKNITGGGLSKEIIIGNIYEPPKALNEKEKIYK